MSNLEQNSDKLHASDVAINLINILEPKKLWSPSDQSTQLIEFQSLIEHKYNLKFGI